MDGRKRGEVVLYVVCYGIVLCVRGGVMCYDLFDASYLIAAARKELHFIIGGFSKD